MREGTRWFRGLFGRQTDESPTYSDVTGESRIDSVVGCLLETESRISDVVHATSGETVRVGRGASGVEDIDAAQALTAAYGAALTGRRVAAILAADRVGQVVDRLRGAVERHVPMVVYAIVRDTASIDALATTGAPVAVARDARHALDLALVARRLSESTLIPAVVVIEEDVARGISNLSLHPEGLIQEYLGDPGDTIPCPSSAQQVIFGEFRRRVPRWFDLERPTAHGQSVSVRESAAASEARHTFFLSTLEPALTEAIESYSSLTGRDVGMITRHGLADAKGVLVAQGALVELAKAVVDRLRDRDRLRAGVLGVNWRLPFPADKISNALAKTDKVTVLSRGVTGSRAWTREIRLAAAASGDRTWIDADYERPSSGAVVAACRNMLEAAEPRPAIHLGIRSLSTDTDFPKRQALLHRLRRDFTELEQRAVWDGESLDTRPAGSKTVAFVLESSIAPETALRSVIETLAKALGPQVRGRAHRLEGRQWELRLTFSDDPFTDPGDDVPVDVMLVADLDRELPDNPLLGMTNKGAVVVAHSAGVDRLAEGLPGPWRDAIGGLELSLYRVERGTNAAATLDALAVAAQAVIGQEADGVEQVSWNALTEKDRVVEPVVLPLAVRRFGAAGETYDNVARFWSELVQPRMYETAASSVPDPYVASASVPACTSTFFDATPERELVPVIDPGLCTGCGKCWVSCPDSAIGAVAISTAALLDWAAERVDAVSTDDPTEAVGKLRRAHKQLASKIDGNLARAEAGTLEADIARESFEWLAGKMGLDEAEQQEMQSGFAAAQEQIEALPLAVTESFFREPHGQDKGSGELLMLAINPQSCQSCGICSQVCPDDAIRRVPQTPEIVQQMRTLWRTWEEAPDSSGATIARMAQRTDVGPLAAVLLSRHCLLSVTGGGAEPGSGERVATRQVGAVAEYRMQRLMVGHVEELAALETRLREAVRDSMAQAVTVDDLGHLDDALKSVQSSHGSAGELMTRLDQMGENTDLDLPYLRRLVDLTREVAQLRRSLAEGAHGTGRARYGVVLAGGAARDWAGRFPNNPFSVPLAVDLDEDGAEVAIGLVEGLLATRVDEARLVRRALLWIDKPSDLPAKDRELDRLDRHGLTAEESELCPPILVLADSASVTRRTHAGLMRLLTSGLPLKVLWFDGCDLTARRASVPLVAMAHRRAFVLSTSIADPDHLFEGVTAALRYPGPALIDVHTPSPRRHGFPSELSIDRAALAVLSRVHPVLRFDPAVEGVFGLRIDLVGNPAVDRRWAVDSEDVEWTPRRWAEGERRFEDSTLLPDARGSAQSTVPGPNGRGLALGKILDSASEELEQVWSTLQELSGVVTPFTEVVRSRAETEVQQAHEAALADLTAEFESRLEIREQEQAATQADRLRRRLLQLTGYGER